MSDSTDIEKPGILYVDDEEKALKYFAKAFSRDFRVLTASNVRDGLETLEREGDSIALVLSDQRMPEATGVEFLSKVYALYPSKIRILTTAYSDLDSAIQSVNQGRIYQYVVKPWDLRDLQMILRRAYDFYSLLTERNELMSIKMSTFQRIVLADRTKTLQVISSALGGEVGDGLLSALSSLIAALPTSLDTNPARAGNAFLRGGLQDLMRQERETHERILTFWQSNSMPLDSSVSLFAEKLQEQLGGENELHCSVESGGGAHTVSIQSNGDDPAAVLHSIFGVLTEPSPSDSSLILFRLLPLLEKDSGALILNWNNAQLVKITGCSKTDNSALEEELETLYDRWDSNSL
tara:strand:- start:22617 stop:23666 length:1050 start_codon:yes stop_codon:yes gene_type:complete